MKLLIENNMKNDKTKIDFYEGRIDYDNDYLKEIAISKNIKII